MIGAERDPTHLPAVRILDVSRPSNETGSPLTQFERQLVVTLEGYVSATGDTPGEALLAAADLANDIDLALETDPTIGDLVHQLLFSYAAVDGAEYNLPLGVGYLSGSLTLTWHETRGSV